MLILIFQKNPDVSVIHVIHDMFRKIATGDPGTSDVHEVVRCAVYAEAYDAFCEYPMLVNAFQSWLNTTCPSMNQNGKRSSRAAFGCDMR